jgi:hypothetical protein
VEIFCHDLDLHEDLKEELMDKTEIEIIKIEYSKLNSGYLYILSSQKIGQQKDYYFTVKDLRSGGFQNEL